MMMKKYKTLIKTRTTFSDIKMIMKMKCKMIMEETTVNMEKNL